jgi:DNA-binding NtrC family response regulator
LQETDNFVGEHPLQETGKLINPSPDPILIVDDDRKMRVIMKTLIESSGWTTIETCDGVQALEMYAKERPSVVLLDMLMPKMDGLETLRALKSLDSDLPVIIITAHSDVSDAVNAIKIGAYDFIPKLSDSFRH